MAMSVSFRIRWINLIAHLANYSSHDNIFHDSASQTYSPIVTDNNRCGFQHDFLPKRISWVLHRAEVTVWPWGVFHSLAVIVIALPLCLQLLFLSGRFLLGRQLSKVLPLLFSFFLLRHNNTIITFALSFHVSVQDKHVLDLYFLYHLFGLHFLFSSTLCHCLFSRHCQQQRMS